MEKEEKVLPNESSDVNTLQDVDYVQAINELKANSVPKEKYSKLVEEHNRLLKSVIDGTEVENAPTEPEPIPLNDLRKQLFEDDNITNLDYAKKALKLRERIIEEGGVDPFLPVSHHHSIQQSDIDTAEKVAKVLQECIDGSEDNSEVFSALLNSRLIDPTILKPKRR